MDHHLTKVVNLVLSITSTLNDVAADVIHLGEVLNLFRHDCVDLSFTVGNSLELIVFVLLCFGSNLGSM